MNKTTKIIAGLSFTAMAGAVIAATQTMTADISFVSPITLTPVDNLDFGDISVAAVANNTFTVGTDGSMTATDSAEAYGAHAPGTIDITASNALVDITVDNITATNAEFSLGSPTCSYDGGASAPCDAGNVYTVTPADTATYTMAIGMTLTMLGTPSVTDYTETFDVNVNYQ